MAISASVGRRELDVDGNEISFRGWIYRDLLRPIAEVDAAGNVVARYVYSDGSGARQNGLSQLETRLGASQDTSPGFRRSNVPDAIEFMDALGAVTRTLVLSKNQVGSVQMATNADTGEVVQRMVCDDFGRVVVDTAPGTQPFGFAGGLYDEASELVRFGARDYSAGVGRWIARDPVALWAGPNTYQYVDANPIDYRDIAGFDGGASAAAIASAIVGIGCGLWASYETAQDILELQEIGEELKDLGERAQTCSDVEEMGEIDKEKTELERRSAKLLAGQATGFVKHVFICGLAVAATAAAVIGGS